MVKPNPSTRTTGLQSADIRVCRAATKVSELLRAVVCAQHDHTKIPARPSMQQRDPVNSKAGPYEVETGTTQ